MAVTILVSAAVDFEHKTKANPEHIADAAAREAVKAYAAADARFADLSAEIAMLSKKLAPSDKSQRLQGRRRPRTRDRGQEARPRRALRKNKSRLRSLRKLRFARGRAEEEAAADIYSQGKVPPGVETDGRNWRIKDWGFRVVSTRLGAKPRQTWAAAISRNLACAYAPEGWLGCPEMARTRLGSGIARDL